MNIVAGHMNSHPKRGRGREGGSKWVSEGERVRRESTKNSVSLDPSLQCKQLASTRF